MPTVARDPQLRWRGLTRARYDFLVEDLAVVRRSAGGAGHPTTGALVMEVTVTSRRPDLLPKLALYAVAGVDQCWVLDLRRQEVVVHTEPGEAGYGSVLRRPWSESRAVLGLTVDLAAPLGDTGS